MEQKNINTLNEFSKKNKGNFKSFVFSEEKETRKLNLKTKKFIVEKIKEYNMNKVSYPTKNAMVAIPDTEDKSGKPMFINSILFNKLCDHATEGTRS